MSELIQNIIAAVVEGKKEATLELVHKGLEDGIEPLELINKGLTVGLDQVGYKFENGEYYLPDMMMAAGAMNAAIECLEPYLEKNRPGGEKAVRVVIGTVKGDLHSIGKDIVIMVMKAAGMEVIDLGVDVSSAEFVRSVNENNADVLGISALMTTTIQEQKKIIDLLREKGLRDRVKVIVGGAPLSEEWAVKVGADAYAADALVGVRKVKNLLGLI
ncbi:MAG TPA: corrinoid protein [Candidatus Limnocylindrales bacterium]|nr:corrinoid protein [Candidatus Limnocylindrales bacterium]